MTPTEILNEIYRLPVAEQKALRKKLLNNSEPDSQQMTQDEFDRVLFEEGFLANLPDETVEDDDFEPVEFTGKPISETIIEERR
jgi:hypothetical protein